MMFHKNVRKKVRHANRIKIVPRLYEMTWEKSINVIMRYHTRTKFLSKLGGEFIELVGMISSLHLCTYSQLYTRRL